MQLDDRREARQAGSCSAAEHPARPVYSLRWQWAEPPDFDLVLIRAEPQGLDQHGEPDAPRRM
jgi:hypothetical protein